MLVDRGLFISNRGLGLLLLWCSHRGHYLVPLLKFAFRYSFTLGGTNWDMSPPSRRISFTVEELIKEYSALDIRKIVSSSGKSSLFVCAIPNSASKSEIALRPRINM